MSFTISNQTAQLLNPLLACAQQVAIEVVWAEGLLDGQIQPSQFCHFQDGRKLIIMSKANCLEHAKALPNISLDTVLVSILAHEMGHAFAYISEGNFFSETLAWETGLELVFKLYGSIPEDCLTVGDHCLESYVALHGSIEEAEVFMTQQFTEFVETTGF